MRQIGSKVPSVGWPLPTFGIGWTVTRIFSHQVVTAADEGATAAITANYDRYRPQEEERLKGRSVSVHRVRSAGQGEAEGLCPVEHRRVSSGAGNERRQILDIDPLAEGTPSRLHVPPGAEVRVSGAGTHVARGGR